MTNTTDQIRVIRHKVGAVPPQGANTKWSTLYTVLNVKSKPEQVGTCLMDEQGNAHIYLFGSDTPAGKHWASKVTL